ncbi:MAG: 1-deoxy-D-xylulose-5-phosphate reductoisomerase [Candidatus Omnitrophica bacterium]|nr:1-deoxy-D-xylulose-5-phosphate reductoisomerase [Candidatus Omnitrophota bacterium]
MKNVLILGSTGSIGINALKVIEHLSDSFRVIGLTAYNNYRLLESQTRKFRPKYIATHEKNLGYLKKALSGIKVKTMDVERDLGLMASLPEVDIVVIAMPGSAALIPFLSAVRSGKIVAPANKEAIVIAGGLIMSEAGRNGAKIIPVDSEQSAIFQCLEGRNKTDLRKVHLTASGGALLNTSRKSFDKLTVKDILAHPRWKMGKKITVDSASLMNKGFEVIEAKWLFDLSVEDINVVIHPEAIVHSMIELTDGSIIAQMAVTDMRLPIQYALTYPKRLPTGLRPLDLAQWGKLSFLRPDFNKFPALSLAIDVAKKGGALPCVLNAANEVAVEAFLNGEIKFTKIVEVVEKIVLRHKPCKSVKLNDINLADQWAREETKKLIG